MAKWIKPNGTEIETNDELATIAKCESLKWVRQVSAIATLTAAAAATFTGISKTEPAPAPADPPTPTPGAIDALTDAPSEDVPPATGEAPAEVTAEGEKPADDEGADGPDDKTAAA